MNTAFSMMDLLIIGCGLYVLYIYYLLKYKGEIKETLLLPKGVDPKKCSDKKAYVDWMAPKVFLYGMAVILCGVMGALENHFQILGRAYLLILAAFLAVTFWFSGQVKKAVKQYWK